MFRAWQLSLIPVSLALLMAADQPQPWKDKQASDWNDGDTKLILTDSPWAKVVRPALEPVNTQRTPTRSPGYGMPGGMGRRGGYGGYPGGYPGGGYPGGYPGGGYPGGGYPGGGYPTGSTYPNGNTYPNGQQSNGDNAQTRPPAEQPPQLTLRWESALPIHEAVLKAHDKNAPTVDEGYYALAVYGVPGRMVDVESKSLPIKLRHLAKLRRDGQKDLLPSSVLVLQRDSGPVFVYLFAHAKNKKKAIVTPEDKRIDFEAQIGRLKFGESFFLEDMVYQGKLEL
jgi:hypothetical protein